MLNIYQDASIKSGMHQNSVTTVGTGGAGLWERSWSRAYAGNIFYNADPNDPENDPMRAMCFASELGRAYIGKIYNQDHEAYRHTKQGMADTRAHAKRMIEIINEADEIEDSKAVRIFAEIERTGLFESTAPNSLEDFINQYLDDWYEQHQNLMQHAHATHQLGQHLAMQGFLNHDPNLIRMGRAAIKRSTEIATYPTGTSSYEPKPAILDQHMEHAVSYIKATLSENGLDDGPHRETAAYIPGRTHELPHTAAGRVHHRVPRATGRVRRTHRRADTVRTDLQKAVHHPRRPAVYPSRAVSGGRRRPKALPNTTDS